MNKAIAALCVGLLLALLFTGGGAFARMPSSAQGLIGVAWPAPAGHFQPRARDIPFGSAVSSLSPEQEAFDRALDEKLKICRGC